MCISECDRYDGNAYYENLSSGKCELCHVSCYTCKSGSNKF